MVPVCRWTDIRKKIKRHPIPPRRFNPFMRLERLISVFAHFHLIVAIPNEIGRQRRATNFLIIQINQCPRRVGLDRHDLFHTTTAAKNQRDGGNAECPWNHGREYMARQPVNKGAHGAVSQLVWPMIGKANWNACCQWSVSAALNTS